MVPHRHGFCAHSSIEIATGLLDDVRREEKQERATMPHLNLHFLKFEGV